MRLVSLLAGLFTVMLAVTPVAASPNERDDHDSCKGNQGREWNGHNGNRDCNQGSSVSTSSNSWDNGSWWDNDRRGFFRDRRDKMASWQADVLSDFLQDCVSVGNLRDLSWWRLRWLVSVVGLDDDDRGHIHSLRQLSDALGDRLEPRDVRNLKVGELLQVGRACGLSSTEVLDLLLQF